MMKEKTNQLIFMIIIVLMVVGFLFFTSDGRCILKGGQLIDSYAGIQECHSQKECSNYKSKVCLKDDDIVP